MNEEEIKGLIYHLEEVGASSDIIDEVVAALPKRNNNESIETAGDDAILLVKKEIADEPDWRKRASLAAGIISNKLDKGY